MRPGFWGRTAARLMKKVRHSEATIEELEAELKLLRKAYRHRTIFATCEVCHAVLKDGEFHKKGCPGYDVEQRAFADRPERR